MKFQTVSLSLLVLCLVLVTVPAMAQEPSCLPFEECTIYENGPVNRQVNALLINFGSTVTDSFTNPGNLEFDGFSFSAWLFPGDSISQVEVSIGTTPYGTDLFDGFVNLVQSDCVVNHDGFNVCLETAEFSIPSFSGTAWLTLQNANVPSGDPVYWDQNAGVGCMSQGCPSRARQKQAFAAVSPAAVVPSEAFTIFTIGIR